MIPKSDFKARVFDYIDIIESMTDYGPALMATVNEILKSHKHLHDRTTMLYLHSMAPILMEFTDWLINKSMKDKVKRLYFLSRDGFQPYLIAKKYVEITGIDIDCRYVYLSRQSMKMPGYHMDFKGAVDSICTGGIDVNLKMILKRAGLDYAQCLEVLKELGLENQADKVLNYRQVVELRDKLKQSALLRQLINKNSKEAYDNAMGYLKQEGFMDDIDYAVVDSGWIGTLQIAIEKLVGKRIKGYYFGMYELPTKNEKDRFDAYFFKATEGLGRKAIFSNSLFETICSAPNGMTIGYEKTEERYVCKLKDKDNPNAKKIERNIECLNIMLTNADEIIKAKHAAGFNYRKSLKFSKKICLLLMAKPTRMEVKGFGNYVFSDDVLEANKQYVAADLSLEQIKQGQLFNKMLTLLGIKNGEIHESAWIEGSIVKACEGLPAGGKRVRLKYLRAIRRYKHVVFLRKQIKAGVR